MGREGEGGRERDSKIAQTRDNTEFHLQYKFIERPRSHASLTVNSVQCKASENSAVFKRDLKEASDRQQTEDGVQENSTPRGQL